MVNSKKERIKCSLEKYQYSNEIKNRIFPIVILVEEKKIKEAEREIAGLALELISGLEKKEMSPKNADEYFTFLDIFLDDNFPKVNFSKEIEDIMFEGNILHDLNTPYGPNLNEFKALVQKFLSERKE